MRATPPLLFDGKNIESRKGDSEKLGVLASGVGGRCLRTVQVRDEGRTLPDCSSSAADRGTITRERQREREREREREGESAQSEVEVYYVPRKV